ncbi:MAG: hypothetical protein LUD78_00075 [Clostridiales bacterium]|nr:hypothetical protein [Clostridiales bacterium]
MKKKPLTYRARRRLIFGVLAAGVLLALATFWLAAMSALDEDVLALLLCGALEVVIVSMVLHLLLWRCPRCGWWLKSFVFWNGSTYCHRCGREIFPDEAPAEDEG